MKNKKYIISNEVFKYPYCGKRIESEEFLSEKICSTTIKVRKKIIKKTKWLLIYVDLILRLNNAVVPSQAIGLTILPTTTPAVMRSIRSSHSDIMKKVIIASVIKNQPDAIVFTQKQMDQLYDLALKYQTKSISKEELLLELRGGAIEYWFAATGVIIAIILLLKHLEIEAFQIPPIRGTRVLPHLEWLYGDQKPGNYFGYQKGVGGPRSITVTGLTQNAGTEANQPSSGSWDYIEVMTKLKQQSKKKVINIEVAHQTYTIQNPDRDDCYILSDNLANQMYDSIRSCETDISDIAKNLGLKATSVKNLKDHLFYNKHTLDRYAHLEPIEYKTFDPDLHQALAWKRMEFGKHTADDITWIKHEYVERHHELKYNSGYSEAHNRAQCRFDGAPWKEQF